MNKTKKISKIILCTLLILVSAICTLLIGISVVNSIVNEDTLDEVMELAYDNNGHLDEVYCPEEWRNTIKEAALFLKLKNGEYDFVNALFMDSLYQSTVENTLNNFSASISLEADLGNINDMPYGVVTRPTIEGVITSNAFYGKMTVHTYAYEKSLIPSLVEAVELPSAVLGTERTQVYYFYRQIEDDGVRTYIKPAQDDEWIYIASDDAKLGITGQDVVSRLKDENFVWEDNSVPLYTYSDSYIRVIGDNDVSQLWGSTVFLADEHARVGYVISDEDVNFEGIAYPSLIMDLDKAVKLGKLYNDTTIASWRNEVMVGDTCKSDWYISFEYNVDVDDVYNSFWSENANKTEAQDFNIIGSDLVDSIRSIRSQIKAGINSEDFYDWGDVAVETDAESEELLDGDDAVSEAADTTNLEG